MNINKDLPSTIMDIVKYVERVYSAVYNVDDEQPNIYDCVILRDYLYNRKELTYDELIRVLTNLEHYIGSLSLIASKRYENMLYDVRMMIDPNNYKNESEYIYMYKKEIIRLLYVFEMIKCSINYDNPLLDDDSQITKILLYKYMDIRRLWDSVCVTIQNLSNYLTDNPDIWYCNLKTQQVKEFTITYLNWVGNGGRDANIPDYIEPIIKDIDIYLSFNHIDLYE